MNGDAKYFIKSLAELGYSDSYYSVDCRIIIFCGFDLLHCGCILDVCFSHVFRDYSIL